MEKSFRGVKEMKFSILVPVYNVQEYLEQCVDSLLSQTYEGDYEIILVDDGSTDNSGKICDKYAEKVPEKIKVVHKENQGLISARDIGIEEAKGDYCLFVDSDDFAENNLLQVVNEEIENSNNPHMVIYSFQYYDNHRITQRYIDIPNGYFTKEEKHIFYNILISGNLYTPLWAKAVKTEILKNDPNDYAKYYSKNMGEDWLRSIYLFTVSDTIVCKNTPLYNYRKNPGSISKNFSVEKIEKFNMLHVYNQFLKYIPEWNINDEEYINKIKNRFFGEAMYTFSNFYENAKNNNQRKAVVDFDWDSFLPDDFFVDEIKNSDLYSLMLYKKIKEKDYTFLRIHFLKKAMCKKYKNLKARIKGI
jgi:glycosyltransferase involved in cell wall biosynthesis